MTEVTNEADKSYFTRLKETFSLSALRNRLSLGTAWKAVSREGYEREFTHSSSLVEGAEQGIHSGRLYLQGLVSAGAGFVSLPAYLIDAGAWAVGKFGVKTYEGKLGDRLKHNVENVVYLQQYYMSLGTIVPERVRKSSEKSDKVVSTGGELVGDAAIIVGTLGVAGTGNTVKAGEAVLRQGKSAATGYMRVLGWLAKHRKIAVAGWLADEVFTGGNITRGVMTPVRETAEIALNTAAATAEAAGAQNVGAALRATENMVGDDHRKEGNILVRAWGFAQRTWNAGASWFGAVRNPTAQPTGTSRTEQGRTGSTDTPQSDNKWMFTRIMEFADKMPLAIRQVVQTFAFIVGAFELLYRGYKSVTGLFKGDAQETSPAVTAQVNAATENPAQPVPGQKLGMDALRGMPTSAFSRSVANITDAIDRALTPEEPAVRMAYAIG